MNSHIEGPVRFACLEHLGHPVEGCDTCRSCFQLSQSGAVTSVDFQWNPDPEVTE